MAEGGANAAKVCLVCGRDCSALARVKDAEGRYTCKECFDRAREAKQARTAKPAAGTGQAKGKAADADLLDNSFLLDLGPSDAAPQPGMVSCPTCGSRMKQNAIICVACGYNAKTGERQSVRVLKPEKDRETNAGGGGGGGLSFGLNIHPGAIALVAFLVFGGLFATAWSTQNQAMVIAYAGLSSIFSIVTYVWLLVTAFREGATTPAIIMLIGVVCGILFIYTIYWALVECEDELVKYLFVTAFIVGVAGIFLPGNPLGEMILKRG